MRFRPLPFAIATALVLPLGMVSAGAATGGLAGPGDTLAPVVVGAAAGPADEAVAATVSGELRRLAVQLDDGSAHEVTLVVPARGEAVRVQGEALSEVRAGADVAVDLARYPAGSQDLQSADGGAEVLDVRSSAVTVGAAAQSPTPPTFDGTPRPVFIIAAFLRRQAPDDVTTSILRGDVMQTADPYFRDSTDGAVRLRVAGGRTGMVPWWGTKKNCDYGAIGEMFEWAEDAAGDGYGYGSGAHVLLYTPTVASCSEIRGVADVADGGVAWINGDRSVDATYRRGLVTQQLGHTLTLPRSGKRSFCWGSSSAADGFGWECESNVAGADPYDLMGDRASRGLLNAAQLDGLGLLTAESTETVTTSRTVTLQPRGELAGVRVATFSTDQATYYVEYRTDAGADSLPSPSTQAGVTIHRSDAATRSTVLYAGFGDPGYVDPPSEHPLRPGRTFVTADQQVKVTTIAVSDDEATVQFELAPQPWLGFTEISGATEVEPTYDSGTWHVTDAATVRLTWDVDPSLDVEELYLERNGRRMLTMTPDRRSVTVRLVEGENSLVVRGLVRVEPGGSMDTTWVQTRPARVALDLDNPELGLETNLRTGPITGGQVPAVLNYWAWDPTTEVTSLSLLNPALSLSLTRPWAWVDHPVGTKVWTVRAEDSVGHTSTSAITRTLRIVDETVSVEKGTWGTATSSALLGGRGIRATYPGASTSYAFTGRSVSWVASKGPAYGTAQVRVDGTLVRTIDLSASTTKHQQVVFAQNFWEVGPHTIEIRVVDTGKPVLSDGFAVID